MSSAFLFKNGFALISQSFDVSAGADVFILKELAVEAPSHGTFWVEGTASVVSLHTNIESKVTSRPALSLFELLLANQGQNLHLLVNFGGKEEWVQGVVSIPSFIQEDVIPGFI
jgi:hypothetical protein